MVALACASVLCASIELARVNPSQVFQLSWYASGAPYIAIEVLCGFPQRDRCLLYLVLGLALTGAFGRVFGARTPRFERAASGVAPWVLPALFALTMVFGRSFDASDSADLVAGGIAQVIKGALSGFGWLMLGRVGMVHILAALDALRERFGGVPDTAGLAACAPASGGHPPVRMARARSWLRARWHRFLRAFDEHPFRSPAAVLAVLWLPALIGYAPGLFMWDTATQILQWFGLPNHISSSVPLADSAVLLTQHHPPLHTALMGICVQLGVLVGSDSLGMLIYTCLQYAATVCSFAFACSVLRRLGAAAAFRVGAFLFVALVPAFSSYAVTITKDVLFADALLVLVAELAVMASSRFAVPARRDVALLCLSALAVTLLRSAAVLIAAGGLAVALFLVLRAPAPAKGLRAAALGAALLLAVAGQVVPSSIVYPALGISPSSKREMLSIPIQQVSRYMRDHRSEVTHEEFEVLDAVLDARNLDTLYEPEKSDATKATWREDATEGEIKAFFELWASWFARDPACYLSATANSYYGYFYAGRNASWSYTSDLSRQVMANVETNRTISDLADYFTFYQPDSPVQVVFDWIATGYRTFFQRMPGLTYTMQAAMYDWLLVIGAVYAWRTRSRTSLMMAVPLALVLLMALIGPCNGTTYFRYVYPLAACLPFMWALIMSTSRARRADCSGRDAHGMPTTCTQRAAVWRGGAR